MSETKKEVKINHTTFSSLIGVGAALITGTSAVPFTFNAIDKLVEQFNFVAQNEFTIGAALMGVALSCCVSMGYTASRGVASQNADNVEIVERTEKKYGRNAAPKPTNS